MPKEPSIFINYRRKLSDSSANLLYLMLEQRFPGEVFMDLDLKGGDIWDPEIERKLRAAKVAIALMPPDWLYYPTSQTKVSSLEDVQEFCKLHKEGKCHVRRELEIALEAGLTIIPVLLDGAEQPPKDWLPGSLQSIFDTFNCTKLHFAKPQREAFREFFNTVAEKAKLRLEQASSDNGLFYIPVNQAFPLPEDYPFPDKPSPFIGLKPFTREDARLFFGRSREIYELCYKVIHQNAPRLLLLDGYSGTGKSSLLQAGIIPRIEAQGWAVAYGRREQDKTEGLSGVLKLLETELDGKTEEHRLLILDQVEEAITSPIDIRPQELQELAENLAVAIQSHPQWKFILSFRSEYTTRITKALEEVGLGNDSKYTLYPLERDGIAEAVQSVGAPELRSKDYPLFFIPESLPLTITERLLGSRAGYHIAPLIQVNMELLWEKCRQENGNVLITQQAIRDFIDSHDALLAHYLGKIRENITEGYADDLAILEILAFYTEEKPAAATRLETEFKAHEKFGKDTRAQTLRNELERHYLLATLGDDGKRSARLAHDVLAEVIYRRYAELNTQRRQESENRQFELLLEQLKKQIYQLEYMEARNTLKELTGIGIRRDELRAYFFELLFFWNECGRQEPVKEVLQFWIDSSLLSEAAQQQAVKLRGTPEQPAIRQWLELVDGGLYQDMATRYLAPLKTCMVKVEGGRFERKGFPVEVSSFYLADVPVTFWKYGLFLYANGEEKQVKDVAPSWGANGDHPLVNVSWYDATEYCNWLSEANGLSKVYAIDKDKKDPNNKYDNDRLKWLVTEDHTANGYRLPTEAEWEYAARGRGRRPGDQFAGSDKLDEVGWYNGNSGSQTHPVAKKKPNELGLYDMSGNVREWCWDWHDSGYYEKSKNSKDPKGPDSGAYRVLRGGSWYVVPADACCANRDGSGPGYRNDSNGFRLARAGR